MTQDKLTTETESWRDNIVDNGEGISRILEGAKRIAVLGIKPEDVGGPAYEIPRMLQEQGFDIVPVPVYFPEATEILGQPVQRSLDSINPPADIVLLFRRSADIPQHLADIIAAQPKVVWMQLGIRNEKAAEQLAKAGIEVVQDRCIRTELRKRSA